MSETRNLLAKISALRQRLEQANQLANETRSVVAALLDSVKIGERHDEAMEEAVRPMTGVRIADGQPPRTLTARARRVLERGRELLGQFRQISDDLAPDDSGPLAINPLYRDTVAMIDTSLRTVAILPDSATSQMQFCRGLEATLDEVAARLRSLTAACQRHRQEDDQVARLSAALVAVNDGDPVDVGAFYQLAAELLEEAGACVPLGFLEGDPSLVSHFVACHSLTTARVLARIIRHDPELRHRAIEAVIAALVHDVGMLRVPAEILCKSESLTDEERRVVESHSLVGAQLVGALFPDTPWLTEGVAGHHERLDGTGYPDGLKGIRVRALPRLLAVCDVYSALCTDRPHRRARSTRTAMADTLLLAEQGQLDHHYAECLLSLSFYPVGTLVELTDGSVAVVVATPGARHDLNSPARPVVAVLSDSQGEALARPQHLDLAVCDQISIVRSLAEAERKEALGHRFARWAA